VTRTGWIDEYRQTSYENWQATAPGWSRLRGEIEEAAEPVREWLLGALAPQPGETVLELAAGVGDTGFEAAQLLGENGRLVSTDFSPAMVEAARERSSALGLANVEHRVLDAERMDLEDASVDGVICRFGYMLLADPAAACAETRRVLRPGGRVALGVWGPPQQNLTFSVIGSTLVQRGHLPPPEPGRPSQFALADPEAIRRLLEGAGFTDIRVEPVAVEYRFESVGEYVGLITEASASLARVLAEVGPEERAAIETEVGEKLEPFRGERGYELPGIALCALAR
jgi:SAM-dependent methyltransferase